MMPGPSSLLRRGSLGAHGCSLAVWDHPLGAQAAGESALLSVVPSVIPTREAVPVCLGIPLLTNLLYFKDAFRCFFLSVASCGITVKPGMQLQFGRTDLLDLHPSQDVLNC